MICLELRKIYNTFPSFTCGSVMACYEDWVVLETIIKHCFNAFKCYYQLKKIA